MTTTRNHGAPTRSRTVALPGPAGAADQRTVQFIGNATLLFELGGITILTDPNFLHAGDHAHIGYGLTTRRLRDPAVDFDALPPFDAVLLSHYHGDHFDQIVEAKLGRDVPIVTTPHAVRALRSKSFRSLYALHTWDEIALVRDDRRITITALPGQHGPGPVSALLPQVMGSMVTVPLRDGRPLRMYISGDTLIHDALHEIPKRFPEIDVAFLHLGGTQVMGIVVTLDGKGGVEAMRIVQPHVTIPVHYEEYTVMKSPLEDFLNEARAAGLGDRVRVMQRGEQLDLDGLIAGERGGA